MTDMGNVDSGETGAKLDHTLRAYARLERRSAAKGREIERLARQLAGAVSLDDALTAVEEIRQREYVNGMRCRDFNEALGMVRVALNRLGGR